MNDILDEIISKCMIVVIGSFNPAIFQPDWFLRHSIFPEEEIEGLTAEPNVKKIPELGLNLEYGQQFLVTNDKAILNFLTISINAQRDKLTFSLKSLESLSLMTDAIVKIFKILQETPLSAYGINFNRQVKFKDNIEQLIKKFFNKTEAFVNTFGADGKCGFRVITEKENYLFTFRMEPSGNAHEWILVHANYQFDINNSGAFALTSNFKTNLSEAIDSFKKIISSGFPEILGIQ